MSLATAKFALFRYFYFILCSSLLTACTISFPQVAGVVSLVTSVGSSEQRAADEWLAIVDGELRYLTPVMLEERIVFANEQDVVVFDGWNVTSVIGFGRPSKSIIEVQGETRSYTVRSRSVSIDCGEWSLRELDSGAQWIQECGEINPHLNFIFLDTNGRIIGVDQVIDSSGARVELSKL